MNVGNESFFRFVYSPEVVLPLALIVLGISLGVFMYRRLKQVMKSDNWDNNVWFLSIYLIAAVLSITAFVVFIFLQGIHR